MSNRLFVSLTLLALGAKLSQCFCTPDDSDNSGTMTSCEPSPRDIRSDDTDPYKALVQQHSQQIEQLTAQLQAVSNKLQEKVAFSAHFKQQELTSVGQGSIVMFDSVDINVGGGYDANTGIFRAPFAGIYIFHIKLLSIINHSIRLDIHTSPNSKLIATTESWADPAREVATAQGVVHLDTDQPVWVMAYVIQGETVGQMQGGVYTTFSGYLLYSD